MAAIFADLNLLDYSIWGVLEAKINGSSKPNLAALKASIQHQWSTLSSAYFRRRLEEVVAASGGYIE